MKTLVRKIWGTPVDKDLLVNPSAFLHAAVGYMRWFCA